AHALLRSVPEFWQPRPVLELTDAADPRAKLRGRHASREMGELEMRVTVDEPGDEDAVREFSDLHSRRRGDAGVWAGGFGAAVASNENGAVRNGRRRHRMHRAGPKAQHVLRRDADAERRVHRADLRGLRARVEPVPMAD